MTVGFGTTARDDGRPVQPGDTLTPERAVLRLAQDADRIGREIAACIGDVPLHQHEFDAFVSLAYNIGPGAFCRSTLVKRLRQTLTQAISHEERERLYAAACDEILRWTRAGGRELPGLVKRRQVEYRLCLGNLPSPALTPSPSPRGGGERRAADAGSQAGGAAGEGAHPSSPLGRVAKGEGKP